MNSFFTVYDGRIEIDPVEISEGKFWGIDEILKNFGKNIFTPNFEYEMKLLIDKKLLPISQK